MEGSDEIEGGTPLLSTVDARIEAALFAACRPVEERELAVLFPGGSDVHASLRRLAEFWSGRGISLTREAGGWVMATRRELLPEGASARLRRFSEAAGATLISIAMHQPVTVQQIEEIRGVRLARGIIESIESSGLIRQVGRRRGSGRAVLWEVTETFLDWAGLDQLSDMPTSEEALMLDLDAGACEGNAAEVVAK